MKTMTIESFLRWAFAIELAGRNHGEESSDGWGASSWDAFEKLAQLGVIVQTSGVCLDHSRIDPPHPDALRAAEAVMALHKRGGFDVPDGWYPFTDWADDPHGLIAAEVGRIVDDQRRKGEALSADHVVNLTITCSVLGRGPDWQARQPKVQMVQSGGNPCWFIQRNAVDRLGRRYSYEDNGYNSRAKRPHKGAYQKWVLERSIMGDVLSRLDWQLWQSALECLHSALQITLTDHRLVDFRARRAPWGKYECNAQVLEKAS